MNISLEIDTREVNRAFDELAKVDAPKTHEMALRAGGNVILAYAKVNMAKQGLYDQGNLINSLNLYDICPTAVYVGSRGVIYAAIHEFGGTIRAKRVKNLAIPVTEEARKIGSPRNMPDLKWIPGSGDVSYFVNDSGVQYVLKPSVVIPARPYLRPAYQEHGKEIGLAIEAVYRAKLSRL